MNMTDICLRCLIGSMIIFLFFKSDHNMSHGFAHKGHSYTITLIYCVYCLSFLNLTADPCSLLVKPCYSNYFRLFINTTSLSTESSRANSAMATLVDTLTTAGTKISYAKKYPMWLCINICISAIK